MAANTEEIDIDEFVQDSEDDDPLYKNGPDDMMLTNIDTGIEGLAGDAGDGLGQAPPLLTVAFDLNGVLVRFDSHHFHPWRAHVPPNTH